MDRAKLLSLFDSYMASYWAALCAGRWDQADALHKLIKATAKQLNSF